MSEAFIGEIRLFAGNYAPQNWALCSGQLLSINDNQALFTLLGTTYGGDGVNTFGVPDLRGRVPVGAGQGAGLTQRVPGQSFGSVSSTVLGQNMPSHTHAFYATSQTANTPSPVDSSAPASLTFGVFTPLNATKGLYSTGGTKPNVALNPATVSVVNGGSAPHSNLMGSIVLNYIIALAGTFPPRP